MYNGVEYSGTFEECGMVGMANISGLDVCYFVSEGNDVYSISASIDGYPVYMYIDGVEAMPFVGEISQDQAFANYYESIRYQYDGQEATFTYDAANSDNYTCVYQFRRYIGANSYENVFYYMDLTTGTVRTQIYDEIPADSAAMPPDGAEEVMPGIWFVRSEENVFYAWDYL